MSNEETGAIGKVDDEGVRNAPSDDTPGGPAARGDYDPAEGSPGGGHDLEGGRNRVDERSEGSMTRLAELMSDMHVGMLTTFGAAGVRSVPMARQEVEPGAEIWFITARETDHVRAITAEPSVALTFSSRDAWVAATGTASIVDDQAKLRELWNTFADAWLPEGPDDPNATLIRVDIDHAEYWDTPGGKVASLISFAKTRLTGDTYDAEHGTVDP